MVKTLETHLKGIRAEGKALIVPYIMAGAQGLDQLEAELQLLEEANVSAIEIGIPFSDPVADGPVIQAAGLKALEAGVSLKGIIKVIQETKVQTPLVIMSYFNPIYGMGIETFINELKETTVKGLIIPDLPAEHQDYIQPYLAGTDIAIIQLVSLTSPEARIKELVSQAEGFIYAVTVNGTTGQRQDFDSSVGQYLMKLSQQTEVPVLAGFGISQKEQVEQFLKSCDGAIIGSKIVNLFLENRQQEVKTFMTEVSALTT
ncbi:tryptophan synthase subunit alpha [Vagococcus sp. BWB3-3]|uniref:Tryptophan synthase alpha chain n=1 Tax=Vagococcus allomyrinae TaxID=2794353 RepID=A0A940PCX6_9ENTE|nr:tryptophan synthase subunit alpha [Vagococcus allomyrinae]MBP1041673.1 tryptophan synthase subunit alpha [Vagococcus allomyrinae]